MSTSFIDWYTFTADEWQGFTSQDWYYLIAYPLDNGLRHSVTAASVHVPGPVAAQVHHEKREATVWLTHE